MLTTKSVAALALIAAVLAASIAWCDTIRVPQERPTIAGALGIAVSGDVVLVSCGSYNETSLVIPLGVTLRSEFGDPSCVTIDGQLSSHRILRIVSAHSARVEGITITRGGTGHGSEISGGVLVTDSQGVTLERCNVEDNTGSAGAGLRISKSAVTMSNCNVADNHTDPRSGASAIRADSSTVALVGCTFQFNAAPFAYGFDMMALGDCSITASATRFVGNNGAIYVSGGNCVFEDCRFERNGPGHPYSHVGLLSLTDTDATVRRCSFTSTKPALRAIEVASSRLAFENCTWHADSATTFVEAVDSDLDVRSAIFSRVTASTLFRCTGGTFSLSCSDLFHAASTEWIGCTVDTTDVIRVDPQFCDVDAGDFQLAESSPCAPGNSPCGSLIGAFGLGCGPVSIEARSWSGIKSLYR